MMDKKKINDILQKSGADESTKQQISNFVNNLGEKDLEKLNNIIGDKKITQDLLNSPQAKNIIKHFGDKK